MLISRALVICGAAGQSTKSSDDEKLAILSAEQGVFFWIKRHNSQYSLKLWIKVAGILFEDVITLMLRKLQLEGKHQEYLLSDVKGRVLEDFPELLRAASDVITLVPKTVAFRELEAVPAIWSGPGEDLDAVS